ncbi:MAG: V-type ATP synthase subunit E [Oscillospiraceae bacterium]|nr:V-type ATP synthase subunit E [Oscillospiraceae bacterium]
MKGIDNIISRLEAEARSEIDALNAETRAQCDALLAEFRQKADEEYSARMKSGREAAQARAERVASGADLESRKALLAFKQETVSGVFDRAAERLAKLPEKEYIDFLASQAAKAADTGRESLIFNARDAKSLGEKVAAEANRRLGDKGKLSVAGETRDIAGGVIVKNGDVETNCSIDMLVALRRADLAGQVAEILFSA